jgi:hypothetical protein
MSIDVYQLLRKLNGYMYSIFRPIDRIILILMLRAIPPPASTSSQSDSRWFSRRAVAHLAEALRLVACPLNLAVDSRVERQIRDVGRIRAGERLIACVALGPMAGTAIRFARSPRRPIDEVVSFVTEE